MLNMRQFDFTAMRLISLYGVRHMPESSSSAACKPACAAYVLNMRQFDFTAMRLISLYGVRHMPESSSSAACKPACAADTADSGACSYFYACSSFVHVAVERKF